MTPSCRRRVPRLAHPAAIALAVCLAAMIGLTAGGLFQPVLPVSAAALQPHGAPAEAAQEHAGGTEAATSHEGASPWTIVARLFNFAVLAGTLVYFLRSPFVAFLARRREEIRAALVEAATLERRSAAQLADVDRRMAALPADIEALRARGMADVAAEEARIRAAAEADRTRLLEQARRQADLQLRVARRELVAHAADLAVSVASERIKRTIRDDDQRRLVETYVSRVGGMPAAGVARPDGGLP